MTNLFNIPPSEPNALALARLKLVKAAVELDAQTEYSPTFGSAMSEWEQAKSELARLEAQEIERRRTKTL